MIDQKMIVFSDRAIRRTFHNNEWWFAIADVVSVFTDTVNSSSYIKKNVLKRQGVSQRVETDCHPPLVGYSRRRAETCLYK